MIRTDRKIRAQDSEPTKNNHQYSVGIVILAGLIVSCSVILLSTNAMKHIHALTSDWLAITSHQKVSVPVIFHTKQPQSNGKKSQLYLTTRCLASQIELPRSLLELGKRESITIQLSHDTCQKITCGPFSDASHISRWHEIIRQSIHQLPEIYVKQGHN